MTCDGDVSRFPQFSDAEAEQLGSVQTSLSEFRGLVRDIVLTACNTALLEAGFPTEDYIEELAMAVRCGTLFAEICRKVQIQYGI